MKIEKLSLGALQTNCYLIYDNNEGIIIDPADEAEFIAQKINESKFKPKAIIATHGHFDHILAAGELQMIFNIPFFIHQNDEFLLKQMNSSASHWLNYKINKPLPENIKYLKLNDAIAVDDLNFKIIETPGHTPGSICIYAKLPITNYELLTPILFSGDTLFKNGIGRYDFSYSSKMQSDRSLKKLFQLPKNTLVYPGHGEKTTIGNEIKI